MGLFIYQMFLESAGPGIVLLATAIILDILDLWLIVIPPLPSNSFLILLGISTSVIGYLNNKSRSRQLTLVCAALHCTTALLIVHSLWIYSGMLSVCQAERSPFCKQMVSYSFPTGLVLMISGVGLTSLYLYADYQLYRYHQVENKLTSLPDDVRPTALVMGQPVHEKPRIFQQA